MEKLSKLLDDYLLIRIEKRKAIDTQSFEKAANCRDREKNIIVKIYNFVENESDVVWDRTKDDFIYQFFEQKFNLDIHTLNEYQLRSILREKRLYDIGI